MSAGHTTFSKPYSLELTVSLPVKTFPHSKEDEISSTYFEVPTTYHCPEKNRGFAFIFLGDSL
jgi:hypothetical protein